MTRVPILYYYLPRTIPITTQQHRRRSGSRRWSPGPNQSADQRHDVTSLSRHTPAGPADTRSRICARRSAAARAPGPEHARQAHTGSSFSYVGTQQYNI